MPVISGMNLRRRTRVGIAILVIAASIVIPVILLLLNPWENHQPAYSLRNMTVYPGAQSIGRTDAGTYYDNMELLGFVTADAPSMVLDSYNDLLLRDGWTLENSSDKDWFANHEIDVPYYRRSEHFRTELSFTAFQGPFFGAPWARLYVTERVYGLHISAEIDENGSTKALLKMIIDTPSHAIPPP